jgi:hypothetical protein
MTYINLEALHVLSALLFVTVPWSPRLFFTSPGVFPPIVFMAQTVTAVSTLG